jgi:hypothetical protein
MELLSQGVDLEFRCTTITTVARIVYATLRRVEVSAFSDHQGIVSRRHRIVQDSAQYTFSTSKYIYKSASAVSV